MRTHSRLCFLLIALAVASTAAAQNKDILWYSPAKAQDYAANYCRGGNDCKSGTNGQYEPGLSLGPPWFTLSTDCTHFVSHILNAGGVKVSSADANCDSGLMIRVRQLATWFSDAIGKHSNVSQVQSWKETKAGDYVVMLKEIDGALQPYHAALLAAPATAEGAKTIAHAHDYCGNDDRPFDTTNAKFYRIDNPFEGDWTSQDKDTRFSLAIRGRTVTWTERRADGKTLQRPAELEKVAAATYRIRRANDDAVLQFLEFPDPTLRAAIIAAGPKDSYIDLEVGGDSMRGQWHGLAVKKKANGTLGSLVQPGTGAGKSFVFKR